MHAVYMCIQQLNRIWCTNVGAHDQHMNGNTTTTTTTSTTSTNNNADNSGIC